jgi:hypothetical protein
MKKLIIAGFFTILFGTSCTYHYIQPDRAANHKGKYHPTDRKSPH